MPKDLTHHRRAFRYALLHLGMRGILPTTIDDGLMTHDATDMHPGTLTDYAFSVDMSWLTLEDVEGRSMTLTLTPANGPGEVVVSVGHHRDLQDTVDYLLACMARHFPL